MNIEECKEKVDKIIKHRVAERVPVDWLYKYGIEHYYVAGNSLNRGKPHDIDIFPTTRRGFNYIEDKEIEGKILLKTKNALTIKTQDGCIIQFCNYYHKSLEELVDSFDFAHIQIGVEINLKHSDNPLRKIYYSNEWITSNMVRSTWYTHSEYPLSSLIRTIKYIRYGDFSGKSYLPTIFAILIDLIKRGFNNYKDFKDQLDAVDLGIVDKDLEGCNLVELFNLLDNNKREKEE